MSSRWGPPKEKVKDDDVSADNEETATASVANQHHTDAAASNDYELIDEVEWGPRRDEEGYDTDQELASKPRRKPAGEDMCGCFPPRTGLACLDESCILYACREECRSNCLAGSVCGNKRIQRKEFCDVEVFDAGVKGKGLRLSTNAKVAAAKGNILCEYTGRAIREAALGRLFRRYQLDRRLYILALGDGVYLDARQKGGIARYINHSCRPNSKVELWTVKGVVRAAVVAMNAIEPGEEVTFDYQWERKKGRAPTVCHCGVSVCRGTLEMSKSLEELDLQRELEGHWEQISDGQEADQTLVNRTVQIFSKEHKEHFLGEVTGFDADKGLHCILYRQEMNEAWEDLSKEDWMILNERVDKEHFIIAKKVQSRRASTPTSSSLTTASAELLGLGQPLVSNNYIYVQTPVKDALWSMHLIERCERSCSVQIHAEQMARPPVPPETLEDAEKFCTLDRSLDGTVWKLTITGANVAKAHTLLQRNLFFLEKKFAVEEISRSSNAAQTAHSAVVVRPLESNVAPSTTDAHEAIFPRVIADAVKRKLQTVRDKCRSVNITFVASDSKSKKFSKLILDGSLLSDIESAKEQLWFFLVGLCAEADAPMAPNKVYRNLGFLGGALSNEQFQLLRSSSSNNQTADFTNTKNRGLSLDASEDLNSSPFIRSFESTYRCTVWIQAQDDQGRIDSSNYIINEAAPDAPRKIYFGCKPSEVARLGAAIQSRATELARGVKYSHLGSDRVYMKLMMKDGGRFFDIVRQITGALVTVDPMTGDHLRIDGRLPQIENQGFEENVNDMTENERASLADEIVRLQVECYRDECIRQQPWIFGLDWTLKVFSSEGGTSSTIPVAVVATGKLDRRSASHCGMDIAETVANLGLGANIAGHAAIILYRFVNSQPDLSTQVKIREALLACIFLANKAQKMVKWKRLDAILQAAYETFYPGAQFDKSSEEAAVLGERVLAAEKEILEAVQFDVFWRDTEWISLAAMGSGKMAKQFVQSTFNFAFSGPVIGAGAELWLKYGIEYIFAAAAAFLKADLVLLFPALELIPLKVSQAAQLLVASAKYGQPSSDKTPSNPLVEGGKDRLEKYLPAIEMKCVEIMSKGKTNDETRAPVNRSVVESRYRIIGRQSRQCQAIRGIPREFVKKTIFPVIENVAAESCCSIYLIVSATTDADDLLLDGPWRATAIADYLLRTRLNGLLTLPPTVDISAEVRDRPSEQAKACPGLLNSRDILTTEGWQGTMQLSDCTDDDSPSHRLGGKCCVPGKVSEASLRKSGLRWWIPFEHGPNTSGSIPDMLSMKSETEGRVDILVDLAKFIAVYPNAFPMLASRAGTLSGRKSERYMPVSLQRWPPEKVASKESAKASKSKSEAMQFGFSASALQEMQILKQLHGVIPSPQGHPNFVVPVGIAFPSHDGDAVAMTEPASEEGNDQESAVSPSDRIYSLFRTNEENAEAAARKKSVVDYANLVFQPTPFVLQRFMSRKLRSSESLAISDAILSAWFHDILSALVHCHANHVVLRTILSDQIVVDQSGIAKIGAMYRSTVLPVEERVKSPNPRKGASAKKRESRKKDDDDGISGNPYAAPEILLGSPKHSKESDVWAIGCLLANLLLNKPIFAGKDRAALLTSQYKIVGSPSEDNYDDAIKFPYYSKPPKKYKRGVEKALEHLLKDQALQYHKAVDLIARMLHLNPKKRCTAAEALGHDYMSEYAEKCRSDSFRQQYVSDWMELKRRMTQASEEDRRMKAEEKTRKRVVMIMEASKSATGEDADDLYNMDDFLANSPPKKHKYEVK